MCQYVYTHFKECGCFHMTVHKRCPEGFSSGPSEWQCENPEYGIFEEHDMETQCQPCWVRCDEQAKVGPRGTRAKIAKKHDQFKGLEDDEIYYANLQRVTDWVNDPNNEGAAHAGPSRDGLGSIVYANTLLDLARGEGPAAAAATATAGPKLPHEYPTPETITPPPLEAPPTTLTTTRRRLALDNNGWYYELAVRDSILTASQRDTMDRSGWLGIHRLSVISRRKIKHEGKAARRRRDDSHEHRFDHIARHTFSDSQREALRSAGHGNLHTLVIKGAGRKTPSAEVGSS